MHTVLELLVVTFPTLLCARNISGMLTSHSTYPTHPVDRKQSVVLRVRT